jgi:hypothetical protein
VQFGRRTEASAQARLLRPDNGAIRSPGITVVVGAISDGRPYRDN